MARRAALRAEDQQPLAVRQVDQRLGDPPTALRAGDRQQQDRAALERPADLAAVGPELLDHAAVARLTLAHERQDSATLVDPKPAPIPVAARDESSPSRSRPFSARS